MAEDLPITGVCIVADPAKCPPNYTLMDKTYGAIPEDADLWKDKIWGRKVTRYMCVERGYAAQETNVLVDVAIINDRDPVPPGFTVVDNTFDTREKAIKKKVLCVRWMDKSMTQDVITELVLLGRGSRKPPVNYTLIGELNGFSLCYKIGRLVLPGGISSSQVESNTVNNYHNNVLNMSNVGSSLPYPLNPDQPTAAPSIRPAGDDHVTAANALIGVPWQLNPKFLMLSELQNITIPRIPYKSLYDVETQYDYDFNVERSTKAAEK
ncbi:multivesicular body subunit 12B [Patella vulgata]|uniref:multivesicular body subunit 12B n=1 Tax=Patella vulgata TaxID=6465 RepID=UPI0021805101|nr:multivesicular body subunit 12B [Patella vulgata]